MGISKTGCSKSITKKDLDDAYKQGFADCAKIMDEYKKELQVLKDKQEQGLIAKCTCGDCIHADFSGCSGDTVYCMALGAYRNIKDSCNKAEAEEALEKMGE